MAKPSQPEVRVREIRSKTRCRFNSEEKIRIVLEGLVQCQPAWHTIKPETEGQSCGALVAETIVQWPSQKWLCVVQASLAFGRGRFLRFWGRARSVRRAPSEKARATQAA